VVVLDVMLPRRGSLPILKVLRDAAEGTPCRPVRACQPVSTRRSTARCAHHPRSQGVNVLFLCTGNSARSILAESILNAIGAPRFRGYSAGSHPTGQVNPFALELLRKNGLPVDGLRSKGWDEFAGPGAPRLDFIFTVCDSAAGEACPLWPGHPATAHWGVADPAAVEGSDEVKRHAFFDAYTRLRNRIQLFVNLPLATLDPAALASHLREIGQR
jgi:arsenate reductase (thioredoxin)